MLTLFQLGYLSCETSVQLVLADQVQAWFAFDDLAWQIVAGAPLDRHLEFLEGRTARWMREC